jgi:hypothetical protein
MSMNASFITDDVVGTVEARAAAVARVALTLW